MHRSQNQRRTGESLGAARPLPPPLHLLGALEVAVGLSSPITGWDSVPPVEGFGRPVVFGSVAGGLTCPG